MWLDRVLNPGSVALKSDGLTVVILAKVCGHSIGIGRGGGGGGQGGHCRQAPNNF